MYRGDVLMVLKDVDKTKIDRAVRVVKRRTEAVYLLPVLKERDLQLGPAAANASPQSAPPNPASQTSTTQPSSTTSEIDELSQVFSFLIMCA